MQGMADLDKDLSGIVKKIKKTLDDTLDQNITKKKIKSLNKICEKLKYLSCWDIMHNAAQKGISLLHVSTTKEWEIVALLDFYLLSAEASRFMNNEMMS